VARRIRGATIAGAAAALLLGTLLAAPALAGQPGNFTTDQLCAKTLTKGPGEAPGVTKSVDASGTVTAGQTVHVTVTQNQPETNTQVLAAGDCVTINGAYQSSLSQSSTPSNVNGPWHFSYTVPDSVKAGDKLCDRAAVDARRTGEDNSAHQKSNTVCLTVASSPTTTTPVTTTAPSSTSGATTTSSSGALPFTGSNTWPMAMVGVGLLAAGIVIAMMTSERRRRAAE
jgi:hypothetical protein